jgi:hypothetical protein
VDDHDLGVAVLAIQDHCASVVAVVMEVVDAPGRSQGREEAEDRDHREQPAHGILSRRGFVVSNPRAGERLRGL